jgi:hypothetical protein
MTTYVIRYAVSDDDTPAQITVQTESDNIAQLACIRFLSVINFRGAWARVALTSHKDVCARMSAKGEITHYLEEI